jgi:hypothetical protein
MNYHIITIGHYILKSHLFRIKILMERSSQIITERKTELQTMQILMERNRAMTAKGLEIQRRRTKDDAFK